MAKPGYGKRSAPDQEPPRRGDFDHLPAREAYLAALLDRLCENAAMDAKTIAKTQPLYGQQSVRSALNELSRAGHLRRVRRRAETEPDGDTGTRWVFHTYWSRTARDSEWWARYLDGDVPIVPETPTLTPSASGPQGAASDVQPPAPDHDASPQLKPKPQRHANLRLHPDSHPPRPSTAYDALARLGLHDPRLALSSADCAALEELAADWLVRGVTVDHLVRTLTAGLPEQVHSPRAFVRRRLVDKLPPERPAAADVQPPRPAPRTLMECTDCGVPGRPEALPGGLCRACRTGTAAGTPDPPAIPTPSTTQPPAPLSLTDVHRNAAHLRRTLAARHDPPQSRPQPQTRLQPPCLAGTRLNCPTPPSP
ncbi:hypothetical protein [Streptomyces lanatus]|uniref:MarR family transcriptional regulator n=1 Tax=Streptomyces lanatus TaxID=66900 RepID=A0ABV1XUT6_9ACTN|nr:hypothetical protein [Streptomyces lanatus]